MNRLIHLLALLLVAGSSVHAGTNTVARPSRFAAELKSYDDKIADLQAQLDEMRGHRQKRDKGFIAELTALNRQIAEVRRERRAKEMELIKAERESGSGAANRPAPTTRAPAEKKVRLS